MENNNQPLFIPLDLNEKNVQTIFNQCLATIEEKADPNLISPVKVLIMQYTQKSSPSIYFSTKRIDQNARNIAFLFGQLHDSHTNSDISLPSGIAKYDGTAWTRSTEELFKLYSMAMVIGRMNPFILKGKNIVSKSCSKDFLPTLSPNDSRFKEWYAEYAAKINEFQKRVSGQEPADN